jgi:hypothetical protein
VNEDEMPGACATCGGKDECVKDFDEKFRRKETNRNKYNIKMNVREIGSGGMVWIQLAHDRDQWKDLVNMLMNFGVP